MPLFFAIRSYPFLANVYNFWSHFYIMQRQKKKANYLFKKLIILIIKIYICGGYVFYCAL